MNPDSILHLLGLAKKGGKLEIGEEPVGAVCRSRHARLLLLASDAAPNTCRRAAHFGEVGNVLWLQLPHTKDELGWQFGRKSCAMVAVTDFGIAAASGEKLALLDETDSGLDVDAVQIVSQGIKVYKDIYGISASVSAHNIIRLDIPVSTSGKRTAAIMNIVQGTCYINSHVQYIRFQQNIVMKRIQQFH